MTNEKKLDIGKILKNLKEFNKIWENDEKVRCPNNMYQKMKLYFNVMNVLTDFLLQTMENLIEKKNSKISYALFKYRSYLIVKSISTLASYIV